MIPHNLGYIVAIITQQFFIVGLVWYAMHLLDGARLERHRYNSTMLLSNASASCDLAALSARLSSFGDKFHDPIPIPAEVRVRKEERR